MLVAALALAGLGALDLLVPGTSGPAYRESPPPPPAPWTELDAEDPYPWTGVGLPSDATTYEGGFVLVGGRDSVWFAGARQSWADVEAKPARLPGAFLVAVATDGRRLVAISLTGDRDGPPGMATWISDDGRSWRPGGRPAGLVGLNFFDLDGSPAGFAIRAGDPAGAGRIFVSEDGATWRAVDPRQFGNGAVASVAGYRGGWLAVGSGPSRNGNVIPPDLPGRAWWSIDGISWSRASISDHRALSRVLPGSAGVLAVGAPEYPLGPSSLYRSADGRSWSGASQDPYRHASLYLSDGQRIVRWANQDDNSVAWSADGAEWHALDEPIDSHALSATMELGPDSLLLTYEISRGQDAPADRFVQRYQVR